MPADIEIRVGRPADDDALARIDRLTWHPTNSPAPGPHGRPFFSERAPADAHLVAEIDGRPAGWLRFGHPTTLPASAHVWSINGLAVTPERQGQGVGRALIHALAERAPAEGVRKITLRVLSTNPAAQGFYASCGFVVEGVLAQEFRIGDQLVDDILMGRHVHPGSRAEPDG